MQKICKNCLLFNPVDGVCSVTVFLHGEKYNLPVNPEDKCHWEEMEKDISLEIKEKMANEENPYLISKLKSEIIKPIEIKQIRIFSDGEKVYMESPVDENQ